MRVIIDDREHDLYDKCNYLRMTNSKFLYDILEKDTLKLGDIMLTTDENKPVLLIERKTIPDLLASIKDKRYEEQSHRLIHSSGYPPHSIFYVIEGGMSQCRTDLERRIVYSAIASMQMFKGFSVYRTFSLAETAEWIMSLGEKIERNFGKGIIPYYLTQHFLRGLNAKREEAEEQVQNNPGTQQAQVSEKDYCAVVKKTKKDNITENNISEIMLCQIPGISSVSAIGIMKHFSSISDLIYKLNENPECLQHIHIETNGKSRKLNKNIIESMKRFLLQNNKSPDEETSENK
jgi:ERCC4-type nuclease|uniref:ERCC4 domain-containing protein n=1 Tax=viral metagenome TaxID=1070528 RepID=A0A6C0INQ4_9ZZZZ